MKKKWITRSVVVLAVVLSIFALTTYKAPTEPATAPEQQQEAAPKEEVPPTEVPPTEPPPTDTPEPTPVPPTDIPEPTEVPAPEPLPPDSLGIEFQAEDGYALEGTYYPAAVNPAPVIVLMHWAPGDQNDWPEIAFWLQNRGLSGTSPNVGSETWLDPTWFPPMLEGQSFGVFTFTFRECDGGCKNFMQNRVLWQLDAKAAMKTAMELEGVDPTQLAAIGASIGADGAPDGCSLHNASYANSCLGALSLSPGSYLEIPYDGVVNDLGAEQPPKPVWCFYANGDTDSAITCKSVSGDNYELFEWGGMLHGMMLIDPSVEPSAMELILDFLKLTFDL